MSPKSNKPIFKYLLSLFLSLAVLVCLYSSLPQLAARADTSTATLLLAKQFPACRPDTVAQQLQDTFAFFLGFQPAKPQTFSSHPVPQTATPATVVQSSTSEDNSQQSLQTGNTLPILETTITVSGMKIREGKSKYIYIDNDTSYTPDISTLMRKGTDIRTSTDGPTVLIVHTHTTESYTPEGQTHYTPSQATRTQDKTKNVVRVGDEIAQALTEQGIRVLHDTTINDYPSYNGAYTKTLGIIEWYLEKYPSIQVVLDVHRDGMTKSDGTKLKVTADIQGKKAAQIMLVLGTNEGGLPHEDWQKNLTLGLQIQDKLNTMYPTLARPLNLRKERFNQHATHGSMIVEVGSDGNTLSEALLAGRCFANALASVLHTTD